MGSSSTEKTARVPKKLKNYELSEMIGRGGMGEVYRAEHPLLGRPVAIKLFAPMREDMRTDENRERFLREGRALAQLRHQGIVGVHDLFEHRNQLAMVLELVDGHSLSSVLEKGAFPLDLTLIVMLELTDALQHAHHRKIIHRDIKAANVMIARDGQVKLMDFGIARDENLANMTAAGVLVGTPMYLAPEVVRGHPASERSDIYGLGALMYHCVSGRRLFEGATRESLFHKIASGKFEPIGKAAPDLPKRFQRIVQRCLATAPEKRYASVTELRRELESFSETLGIWTNHAERVVGYLRAKGLLSDQEAQSWISASQLIITSTFELAPPKLSRLEALKPALLGAGGGFLLWLIYRGGLMGDVWMTLFGP